MVEKDIKSFGYYSHLDNIEDMQSGVLRTNCMDNLDRTNVVQSTFAKYILKDQIEKENISIDFDSNRELQLLINNLWADNGDIIAIQYAGTVAQKSDYTRYGKRTFAGMINDGISSVSRYFINNFSDGVKEDSLNLFVGKYQVSKNIPSPFYEKNSMSRLIAIIILIISIFATFYVFNLKESFLIYFLIYLILLFVNFRIILILGKSIVDKPKLKLKVE